MLDKEHTIEKIRRQYEVEKRLALQLKNSSKEERSALYSKAYDQLFKEVPEMSLLTKKKDPVFLKREIAMQMAIVAPFLSKEKVFLEVGAGSCQFSFEVAKRVKKVYATDVSREITQSDEQPDNFTLLISDGSSVDVDAESIDIVYSHQCIEHIHPDDVVDQFKAISRALIKGGVFICATPHRFNGPHDISKYFDRVATGLHLKEYTNKELYNLLKLTGFSSVKAYLSAKFNIIFTMWPIFIIESVLSCFPYGLRKKLSQTLFRRLLGVYLIAIK